MTLLLLLGSAFSGAACAQAPIVFHGSTLRPAFGADVLVSVTSRSKGEEILRIHATGTSVQPFLSKKLPTLGAERLNDPFEITIGPPSFNHPDCTPTAANLSAFETCFRTRKVVSGRAGLEFVPLARYTEDSVTGLFRTPGVVPGYASCHVMLQTWQLTPRCTVYFEQGGEWHEVTTSSLAVHNMRLFQCAALELRNGVWPDAPRIPDECRP
jgi:hypothetical protein